MTSPSEYNPWQPITDATDLKYIGKLIEELGELSSALSRCIIQGIDETEPTTGKINRQWIEEELSDVKVNMQLVMDRFDLHYMMDRINTKRIRLKQWHDGIPK